MTASERSKILKMVEDGKITPEEGLRLMQVLDDDPLDDEKCSVASAIAEVEARPASEADPDISKTVEKARSLRMIPLWIGVIITTFGGWVMYKNVHPSDISIWFYCLGFPIFILGMLIILLGWGSKTARWLFVSVKQKPGDFPKRILIGFPLPLHLTSWFLRNFGHKIEGLGNVPVDQIIDAVQHTSDPLVVNVDEGDDGEKVQVYIG
ncbi:MAG: hypothetical protein A2X25_08735 [Chloroflexi bacterium GWB2_49_20]|nr:MAG: hypothetical protein A2X25_08735 [Chloroflexi bacterium GWB2_49_20]OGN79481.1 MAG: hypothetical protein A2X26_05290 [Chloroflexi bacterium GWC2_49_37]OGN84596.1 MAG: hypothetical protein A2X27_11240 [Chloroflexi bacterium GWD2_49_16]HCC79294.1 hypothetical protein [Anaerolineae bacterium]HCM97220.1 hypothetical protein [Anaerolineae bacterium]